MLPIDRYQVRRDRGATRGNWYIRDMVSRAIVADDLPSERVARIVKSAMCMAWWDGANGVKSGEVII